MSDIFDRLTDTKGETKGEQNLATEGSSQAVDPTLNPVLESTKSDYQHSRQIKDAVQELMKFGLLEVDKKPNLYQILITHQPQVASILQPLDLGMNIDDVRGLAYLHIVKPEESKTDLESQLDDEWSHPMVRRQRLNMEQSLLIALLRQHFIAHELEAGVGASQARIAIEDLLPQVQLYLGDMGSDAREQTRLRNLLDKLKAHGLVSEVDQHEQITIRPIIAHVANPENLKNLLQAFSQQAQVNSNEQ